MDWNVAMRLGKLRALNKNLPWASLLERAEQLRSSVYSKVEVPFKLIKCQIGYIKVGCKGVIKNTARLMALYALSNVWMVRRHLLGVRVHSS